MKIKNIFTSFLGFSTFKNLVESDTECPNVNYIGDRRSNKSNLRLVQYNVEWLFIDYCSSSNCPGNGCTWKTQEDAINHLSYVSKVVNELNPDILNLCEVEGCDELVDLIQELDYTTYNYYLKKGTDTSTGQNVGMITKVDPERNLYRTEVKVNYPIPNSKCGYTGSGSSGVSKHYITELNINGIKIAFIGLHFIAIPTDPARCAQREAQAQVIQLVISDYISKGYEIIVSGDMNDYDAEVMDINNHHPNSLTLDILKGLDGEKKGLYNLTNVAQHILQNERYSDWYDSDNNCNTSSPNDYSMIDHILVTPFLNNKIADAYVYHGYEEYCGKWNSDHYPVVVEFNLDYKL
jgi:exonuclease III